MTNPKRRHSGNDVGYMEEECKANMKLTAENKRLREALENAPEPGTGIIGAMHYKGTDALIESVPYDLYAKWFDDVRSKALGEDE